MRPTEIVIAGSGSASPLGLGLTGAKSAYAETGSAIVFRDFDGMRFPVAPVTADVESAISEMKQRHASYRLLDRSVLLAMIAAAQAWDNSGWDDAVPVTVNAGSSRGATAGWEKYYGEFAAGHAVSPKASPLTTLGHISSFVAQHLKADAAVIDHSITCGTGLQAIANGLAWLRSGMAGRFIAVASEAPLTGFTIAQMRALGIYSTEIDAYPCRSCSDEPGKKNSMVLGEGAAAFCLEQQAQPQPGAVIIDAIGFGNEQLTSPTSVSSGGDAFRSAMRRALASMADASLPDCIIAHAPGTIAGDAAERNAIAAVFGNDQPAVTSNKWKIGHTFAASGLLSIEHALCIFETGNITSFPYSTPYFQHSGRIRKIMINAMGFGGNAISVILTKV